MKSFCLIMILLASGCHLSSGLKSSLQDKSVFKAIKKNKRSLLIFTWNSEYKSGSKETREVFAKQIMDMKVKPDVVAICQQEATVDKVGNQTLGKNLVNEMSDYEFLAEHKIVGSTKFFKDVKKMFKTGFKQPFGNFTNITVLLRKDFSKKIDRLTVKKGSKRPDFFKGTKGGTWVSFMHDDIEKPLVLACAHLDASDPKKRLENLEVLSGGLESTGSDRVVLAGDLNYRTEPTKLGLRSAKETEKIIKMEIFVINYLNMGEKGFNTLFRASNAFKDLESEGFNCEGFDNPNVTEKPYPPTYKLRYKTLNDRQNCSNYKKLSLQNSFDSERFQAAKKCFFNKKENNDYVPVKAKELNIGYLDRVCVKKESDLKKIAQGSLDIFESDHTPVWSLIEFSKKFRKGDTRKGDTHLN